MEDKYFISYPSGFFNYSDGRFTDSSDTDPNSTSDAGTWHEQLAHTFFGLPASTNSLDGGAEYAFGGATTASGTSDRTAISNPFPWGGGQLSLTVDNLGKQVDDYSAGNTPDAAALYIVWGGGNDLFDDDSSTHVTETAANAAGLAEQLARAGARSILVPNVPPLGLVPVYKDDAATATALNTASAEYRSELDTDLDAATATLAGEGITITLYRLDTYGLYYRLGRIRRITASPTSVIERRAEPSIRTSTSFGTTFIRPPPGIIRSPRPPSPSSTDLAASRAGT